MLDEQVDEVIEFLERRKEEGKRITEEDVKLMIKHLGKRTLNDIVQHLEDEGKIHVNSLSGMVESVGDMRTINLHNFKLV